MQWIFVGTGIINQLFKSDDVLTKFDLSSVKYILTGGSKVRAEVTNRINKVLTSGEILQGYGNYICVAIIHDGFLFSTMFP